MNKKRKSKYKSNIYKTQSREKCLNCNKGFRKLNYGFFCSFKCKEDSYKVKEKKT